MKRLYAIKIFASYLILVFLTIAVLDFLLTPRIKEIVTKGIEDEMIGTARIVALMPEKHIETNLAAIARDTRLRITIVDPTGRVMADSQGDVHKMDNHLNRPEIRQAGKEGLGKSSRFSVTLQESMLYVALPVRENAEVKRYVRMARPLTLVQQSIDHLYQSIHLTLYIIAFPVLLLAIVFSIYIARRFNGGDER